MKQNLLLVCYDYDLTKRLSAKLADTFSMRVFDQKELFEFDHIPRSFSDVAKENGKEYVMKKFRSIFKMELDFENAVFVADNSFAENCFDIFYKIKLNNFVVLFYKNSKIEAYELSRKKYSSPEEKDFFMQSEDTLVSREKLIREDCADICVDITGLSDDEIAKKVLSEIQNFYTK